MAADSWTRQKNSNRISGYYRDYSPPKRTVDEMTADDVKRRAPAEIERLKREIARAKAALAKAESDLEFWEGVPA